jgi:hypothetical protein
MKIYYVIHRNFVYHTSPPPKTRVILSDTPVTDTLDTQEPPQEKHEKVVIESQISDYVEPCDTPECIGGQESDHHAGLWFLFDVTRTDLCKKITDRFPKILECDVDEFISWASREENFTRTVFQHMIIPYYNDEFSPNFDKLISYQV